MHYVATSFRLDDRIASEIEMLEDRNDECDVAAALLQHRQGWRRVMDDVRRRRRPTKLIDRRGRWLPPLYLSTRHDGHCECDMTT